MLDHLGTTPEILSYEQLSISTNENVGEVDVCTVMPADLRPFR